MRIGLYTNMHSNQQKVEHIEKQNLIFNSKNGIIQSKIAKGFCNNIFKA
jgi:hypothetical protein